MKRSCAGCLVLLLMLLIGYMQSRGPGTPPNRPPKPVVRNP
jgi:hypothetical protein